jgi:hypothetical protein
VKAIYSPKWATLEMARASRSKVLPRLRPRRKMRGQNLTANGEIAALPNEMLCLMLAHATEGVERLKQR